MVVALGLSSAMLDRRLRLLLLALLSRPRANSLYAPLTARLVQLGDLVVGLPSRVPTQDLRRYHGQGSAAILP